MPEETKPTEAPVPEKGTPEYNAMMVARYENQGEKAVDPNAQDFKPQRPENVPEKFWNAETGEVNTDALLKSYGEMEKMRGLKTETKEDPATSEADAAATKDAVENAGLNWDEVSQYVATNDFTVSDAHRAALNKSGIPNEIIDGHLELLKGSQDLAAHRTTEYVGGKQNLDVIMQKASQLPPAEVARFNDLLAGPDWQVAMDALAARFLPGGAVSRGGDNKGLFNQFGSTEPGGPTVGFKSQREQNDAMNKRDDRGRRLYDIDPHYREQVRQRVMATR